MIRQALPVSADMHIAVQDAEAAHIDAIQAQQRQTGRVAARRPATVKMEGVMYAQSPP